MNMADVGMINQRMTKKLISAIFARLMFISVAVIGVVRISWVKKDTNYWFLTLLVAPLLAEMIVSVTCKIKEDYKIRCGRLWCSPPLFLFPVCVIPSMWVLELHDPQDKASDEQCYKLDSWENLQRLLKQNVTQRFNPVENFQKQLSTFCPSTWVLALHQSVLISIILGKWLLPLGDKVRSETLSELILTFIGTAVDILEFTCETLSDVRVNHPAMVIVILTVWTWSMLQFLQDPKAVEEVKPKSDEENGGSEDQNTWFAENITILGIVVMQDVPFLIVRMIVIWHYKVFHQMLGFFALKNALVIIVSLYRSVCIKRKPNCCQKANAGPNQKLDELYELDELDERSSSHNSAENTKQELTDEMALGGTEEFLHQDVLC